ncbi:MAG TPA: LptF/LptG family permease, partial [Stellaceae bacterium]|nr:LptF/LptG family permease [Stellaceae bacterium]
MSPWKTLSLYIARQFFIWCGGVFLAIMSIIFLLDYIELIRRASTKPDASLLVLLEMTALKQPYMAQQVMPFAMLFGTMLAFWRMTRANELVVARAAGISVWQFLTPPVIGALGLGAITVAVFNPVASVMQARYENLENRVMHGGTDRSALFRSGLWLRQSDEAGNHSLIHAEHFAANPPTLGDVMVLFFG